MRWCVGNVGKCWYSTAAFDVSFELSVDDSIPATDQLPLPMGLTEMWKAATSRGSHVDVAVKKKLSLQ